MPEVVQRPGDEAHVHQVQHAMLSATNAHIYRQPLAREYRIPRLRFIVAGWIAQEVPGGIQKVIADIRFAPRWLSTDRAGSIDKTGDSSQRRLAVASRQPISYIRQQHRQLIFWNRHRAMFGAIDDGNGRSPVALAAN